MEFLWRWLGPKPRSKIEATFTEEQTALIRSVALPSIRLEAGGEGFSRLGGLPDLPEHMDWPCDASGKSLSFLAQIDLNALPNAATNMGLPETGVLWFFYTQDQDTWGGDPKDRLKWRVLYSPQTRMTFNERWAPDDLKKGYAVMPLRFLEIETFPDLEVIRAAGLDCPDDQLELYIDYLSPDPDTRHIIGGYCDAIQDPDMPLLCQLASNGIPCYTPAQNSPEAQALSGGAMDWRLLLQLGSEDKAKMMWGDGGRLYFWIREDDLRAARFDTVWMIAQCY